MRVALTERAKALLDAQTFVTLATLRPDGSPRLTVMWVTRDGDDVLLSTVIGRAKERDLRRDPRVGVMILDREDPYHYTEVRGSATMTEAGGPELIQELSRKYTGQPYSQDQPDARRVVIRVSADKVVGR